MMGAPVQDMSSRYPGACHDVFEEQIMDDVARRCEVFALENGANVFRLVQRRPVTENALDLRPCILVAGEDDGQLEAGAEPRARVGGGDVFRQFDDM